MSGRIYPAPTVFFKFVENFDAIIIGGSFAGLSAAGQLRGNILLIDKKEIGRGQTSACCTISNVITDLDCGDSILQETDTIILHTAGNETVFKLPLPFATFDYQKFCRGMLKKIDARVIKAKLLAREGGRVFTDKGEYQAKYLIDASGWMARLARPFRGREYLSFGIETTLNYRTENLHFWVNPKLITKGVCWLFPCGEKSRFGVGSYQGVTNLKQNLKLFLSEFGLKADLVHGGFFPHRLREPVIDRVFLAGDSAGQCLPLSGEGIREAIYFGDACGGIVQKVIEEKLSLEQAQKIYRNCVFKYRQGFNIMLKLQGALISLPNFWLTQLLKVVSKDIIFRPVMSRYETMMEV